MESPSEPYKPVCVCARMCVCVAILLCCDVCIWSAGVFVTIIYFVW